MAKVRVLSQRSSPRAEIRLRATSLKVLNNDCSDQNFPMLVCSGVRTVDVADPKAFTSSTSREYMPELSFGGPGSRVANCPGLVRTSGTTKLARGYTAS